MSNYIYNPNSGELYHYGVKGMKWGHRKRPEYVESARANMKSARADKRAADRAYNKSFNRASNYSSAHFISQYTNKKRRAESDERWGDAHDKANAANKASENYKNAKSAYKQAKNRYNQEQDAKINEARKAQSNVRNEVRRAAKDFALASLSGDKATKVAATRKASKLTDEYVRSDKIAKQATSGEKKAAVAMATIATVSVAVAAANQAQAGKRVMNMIYPGLYYLR